MSASKGFTIDINSLPVADGLGPVDSSTADSFASTSSSTPKPPPGPISRGPGSLRGERSNETSANANNTTRNTMLPGSASSTASPTRGTAMSQAVASSPRRSSSPYSQSPTRTGIRSSSPRHLSPATSQIFERDVQENGIAPELSSAIPAHMQTEDSIPPVLEASSLAITDKALSPSDVEIVMHAAHQPAAAAVAASTSGGSMPDAQPFSSHTEAGAESMPGIDAVSEGSTYGAVDPLDPRRLSFISYADLVHAEHEAHHPSAPPSAAGGRSPSPARSSPMQAPGAMLGSPGSGSGSLDPGTNFNSLRRGSASIASPHAQTHGDITVETMAQALEQPLAVTAAAEPVGAGRSSFR